MAWHPHAILTDTVEQLSAKHNLPRQATTAILEDFLKAAHETTYKGSTTEALLGIYFSLGAEAAWHFWGMLHYHLEGEGDGLSDARGMWYETAVRLDGRMSRFSGILDRWSQEKTYAVEQAELDRKDEERKAT